MNFGICRKITFVSQVNGLLPGCFDIGILSMTIRNQKVSLLWNGKMDKKNGREATIHSFWRYFLSSVMAKYPLMDRHIN